MKSTHAGYHLCGLGGLSCLFSSTLFSLPLLSLTLVTPPHAQATELTIQEIVVNDCDGNTRAQIRGDKTLVPHQLNVSLSSKDPMPNTLKLTSSGSQSEERVVKGEASFGNLRSGTYQLCDDQKLARIENIALVPAEDNSTSTVGGIVVGAAAIGGTALALNSGGNSDSSPSSSNSLSESGAAAKPSRPATKPASTTQPTSTSDRDCLNGAKVNPISPFD